MIKLNPNDMAKLTRKINQLKVIDKRGVSTELGKMGLSSVRKMKKTAPIDTGNLRKNLVAFVRSKTLFIRSRAKYSGYVEFGTRFQKPQPYFYPTIRREIKLLIINLENRIKKALK
jgi:HK97 gp10 family phage protein